MPEQNTPHGVFCFRTEAMSKKGHFRAETFASKCSPEHFS